MTRHVRLTLEADVEQAGHRADVLRLRQTDGMVTYLSVSHAAAVTVEDVAPVRRRPVRAELGLARGGA